MGVLRRDHALAAYWVPPYRWAVSPRWRDRTRARRISRWARFQASIARHRDEVLDLLALQEHEELGAGDPPPSRRTRNVAAGKAIFFTVPTARLRVLFLFVVLAHNRRRVVHFNVTEHRTAAWTTQQIMDAFPDDSAPSYLLRDRDRLYGPLCRHRVKGIGIEEVLTAPQSPWQNPFAERLIGSIRRECLNHVLVLGERHLRRILSRYFAYYHQARTHLALAKDTPDVRPIEAPETGRILQMPEVGGLHHRYVRRVA